MFLIDESVDQSRLNDAKILESTIDISGESMHLCIGVNEEPAQLCDIVSLAYAVSDKLCSTIIQKLAANGQIVSCRNGCSACCSYLVALSMPEIYYLHQKIASWEEDRLLSLLQCCFDSAQKILDSDTLIKYDVNNNTDNLSVISQWYEHLGLSCPFLKNDSCSIYEYRPLACREHLVTTSPGLCKSRITNNPTLVRMPISILEVLGQLSAEMEQTPVEAVILPLAVVCGEGYLQRSCRRWPGVMIVERFIAILEAVASKYVSQLVSSE